MICQQSWRMGKGDVNTLWYNELEEKDRNVAPCIIPEKDCNLQSVDPGLYCNVQCGNTRGLHAIMDWFYLCDFFRYEFQVPKIFARSSSVHIKQSFQIIAEVNTKSDKCFGLYNALHFDQMIRNKFFQAFISLGPYDHTQIVPARNWINLQLWLGQRWTLSLSTVKRTMAVTISTPPICLL